MSPVTVRNTKECIDALVYVVGSWKSYMIGIEDDER